MERQIQNSDDKVWVTISRTINLGNYENIKIDAGLSETRKPKEDPMDTIDEICDQLMVVLARKSHQYEKDLAKKKPKKPKKDFDDDED